jgi:phosphohistidine phosphatase
VSSGRSRNERGSSSKRLYLLRHAKSSWDDPRLADHDRPLAARGRRAGELLAEHVRRLQITPELILCSTSLRTRETLALLLPALPPTVEVHYERAIYDASERELLARLRTVGDEVGSLLLVGHDTGIGQLASMLARGGSRLRALREKFPTGGLATLEFACRWRALGRGGAQLTDFVVPRELPRR